MTHSYRRVLYVSYPLVPVSNESCGGAEQMLWLLEREAARRGYRTAVAAAEGSCVQGELIATGPPTGIRDSLDELECAQRSQLLEVLRARRNGRPAFDVVHDKGGSFWRHAAEAGCPVLATLHLPRWFYPQGAFENPPANVFFNCVSEAQAVWFRDLPQPMPIIENGIDLAAFTFTRAKQDYLLWLGRICLEKGPHLALDVAERLGMRIVLAGQIYPFSYHWDFFRSEVLPRLERMRGRAMLVQTPSFVQKTEMLRHARALVLPTLCDETSSLVSMEAMACGTPVVAFRRGGIPDVVGHGIGGFLHDTMDELVEAVRRTGEIDPAACRGRIERRFTAIRMTRRYLKMYQRLWERAGVGAPPEEEEFASAA